MHCRIFWFKLMLAASSEPAAARSAAVRLDNSADKAAFESVIWRGSSWVNVGKVLLLCKLLLDRVEDSEEAWEVLSVFGDVCAPLPFLFWAGAALALSVWGAIAGVLGGSCTAVTLNFEGLAGRVDGSALPWSEVELVVLGGGRVLLVVDIDVAEGSAEGAFSFEVSFGRSWKSKHCHLPRQ